MHNDDITSRVSLRMTFNFILHRDTLKQSVAGNPNSYIEK